MAQQDKDLLLRDLCARLPYNCRVFYEYVDDLNGKTYGYGLTLNTWCINELKAEKATIKPYLRSLASMTEEEKTELFQLMGNGTDIQRIDFYLSHYFDFRCLIPMGLALEAPKEMYNIK